MKRFTKFFLLLIFLNSHSLPQAIHKYSDIFFLDDHNGWILSANGYLWKTTNAGTDWIRINDSRIDTSGKITFVDEQNGWLILSNALLRSNNGGLDWVQEYEFPLVFGGYDIEFTNDSIGFAFTFNKLYKSIDGGETWGLVTDTLQHIYDISFYKDSVGYLCFSHSSPNFITQARYIYKTTDKGETWDPSYFEVGGLNESVYYNKICVLNPFAAIIGTFNESLFGGSFSLTKTLSAGTNWENVYCWEGGALDLEFYGYQEGWVVNWSGIMKTNNNGLTWDTLQIFSAWEDRNTNMELFDLNNSYLINLNHIYKTTDGWVTYSIVDSIVTDIEQDKNQITPTDFELYQNYPNPFNPSTRIIFEIPGQARNDNTHVILKVYDVLGNEVATLVNEYKPVGVYDVDFDGSGLSSGIYFYKLHTGDFTKTNKMILLK